METPHIEDTEKPKPKAAATKKPTKPKEADKRLSDLEQEELETTLMGWLAKGMRGDSIRDNLAKNYKISKRQAQRYVAKARAAIKRSFEKEREGIAANMSFVIDERLESLGIELASLKISNFKSNRDYYDALSKLHKSTVEYLAQKRALTGADAPTKTSAEVDLTSKGEALNPTDNTVRVIITPTGTQVVGELE
jgi:hypothetical protein